MAEYERTREGTIVKKGTNKIASFKNKEEADKAAAEATPNYTDSKGNKPSKSSSSSSKTYNIGGKDYNVEIQTPQEAGVEDLKTQAFRNQAKSAGYTQKDIDEAVKNNSTLLPSQNPQVVRYVEEATRAGYNQAEIANSLISGTELKPKEQKQPFINNVPFQEPTQFSKNRPETNTERTLRLSSNLAEYNKAVAERTQRAKDIFRAIPLLKGDNLAQTNIRAALAAPALIPIGLAETGIQTVAAFGIAGEALMNPELKEQYKQSALDNIKPVTQGIVQQLDPRSPEGITNIGLAVLPIAVKAPKLLKTISEEGVNLPKIQGKKAAVFKPTGERKSPISNVQKSKIARQQAYDPRIGYNEGIKTTRIDARNKLTEQYYKNNDAIVQELNRISTSKTGSGKTNVVNTQTTTYEPKTGAFNIQNKKTIQINQKYVPQTQKSLPPSQRSSPELLIINKNAKTVTAINLKQSTYLKINPNVPKRIPTPQKSPYIIQQNAPQPQYIVKNIRSEPQPIDLVQTPRTPNPRQKVIDKYLNRIRAKQTIKVEETIKTTTPKIRPTSDIVSGQYKYQPPTESLNPLAVQKTAPAIQNIQIQATESAVKAATSSKSILEESLKLSPASALKSQSVLQLEKVQLNEAISQSELTQVQALEAIAKPISALKSEAVLEAAQVTESALKPSNALKTQTTTVFENIKQPNPIQPPQKPTIIERVTPTRPTRQTNRNNLPKEELPSYRFPPIITSTKPKSKKKKGFDVFVRMKGEFVKVSAQPLPKEQAINFGAFKVENTAAATFKVVESGEATGTFNAKASLANFLRKTGNTYIQRANKRIKSIGEKQQITQKGIRANMKKSIFNKR